MTAFADLSELLNRATGGNSGTPEHLWFFKDPRVSGAAAAATIAGRPQSLWQYSQYPMGAGAAPGGTARNPTNATAGSLGQTDPGGGRQKWCVGASIGGLAAGTAYIYDRLADISGLSGTTTGAQTITGLSVTRYTGTAAAGNEIFLEIFTQIGATGTTVTASYTNQAGTAGQSTVATTIGGTNFREAQRIIQLPLASGDTGVRSVESITLAASTLTAGDIGVVIGRPLLEIPFGEAGISGLRPLIAGLPGPVEILAGACLAMYWLPNVVTAPQLFGHLFNVER